MIIRVLKSSVICLAVFFSCHYTSFDETEVISQRFIKNDIIICLISNKNNLLHQKVNIYNKGKLFHTSTLKQVPCEIIDVVNDSIYFSYYVFANRDIKSESKIEYLESINNSFTLVFKHKYFDGTFNLGTQQVDSVIFNGKDLCTFYYKSKYVDSVNLNYLIYNGEDFHVSKSKGTNRYFKLFRISDKSFIKSYKYLKLTQS